MSWATLRIWPEAVHAARQTSDRRVRAPMLRRICWRRSSSSCSMKKRAHLLRWTMDDRVITHVKKWVCDSSGTRWVIILDISLADDIVWRVCALKASPAGKGRYGAHEFTARVGEESSWEWGWWRRMEVLNVIRGMRI